jgi:hypothetical protein
VIVDKDPNVYDNNDYTPRLRLEQDDPETGLPIPATGITDLDVWIAATAGGAAIHTTLKARAVEMTGLPGTYRITINGGDIHTNMASGGADIYDKKDVYIEAMNVGRNVYGSERVKFYKIRRVS